MAIHIPRREFITLLGGAAAAWPLKARAQPSGKLHRIGFLGVFSYAEFPRVDVLRTGLRQLGYEEGKNIVIHYRWAEGRYDRLPDLAAELVNLNVDVIVTHTTPGLRAAKQATSTIPIVVAAMTDPVDAGLVTSLARPGGNLTGLTFFFAELCAKRVELIKEAIPTLTRLAVFVDPANPSHPIALAAMQRTAAALGVELVPIELKARDEIAAAVATAATRQAPALVVIEGLFISNVRQIAGFALQSGLPMIGFKPHAEAGALMEYGVDLADLFYRSASFVDKILKGTPPADLPIERAVKFDLVLNLKSARTLGLELPTSLLIRADEVIE
jgi:putative tryptophan/tyrosine transport system substrate-binding protein